MLIMNHFIQAFRDHPWVGWTFAVSAVIVAAYFLIAS